MVTCPECFGEKTVQMLDEVSMGSPGWAHEETCPECNGTGSVEAEEAEEQ